MHPLPVCSEKEREAGPKGARGRGELGALMEPKGARGKGEGKGSSRFQDL